MLNLPDKIKNLIGNEKYFLDNIGMSDSTVILFHNKILKVQMINEESENEYRSMKWLQDKLPVPMVLGSEREGGKSYLLMTKVSGKMACADQYMKNSEQLISLLAEGLKIL